MESNKKTLLQRIADSKTAYAHPAKLLNKTVDELSRQSPEEQEQLAWDLYHNAMQVQLAALWLILGLSLREDYSHKSTVELTRQMNLVGKRYWPWSILRPVISLGKFIDWDAVDTTGTLTRDHYYRIATMFDRPNSSLLCEAGLTPKKIVQAAAKNNFSAEYIKKLDAVINTILGINVDGTVDKFGGIRHNIAAVLQKVLEGDTDAIGNNDDNQESNTGDVRPDEVEPPAGDSVEGGEDTD